jgi:TolB-like protein
MMQTKTIDSYKEIQDLEEPIRRELKLLLKSRSFKLVPRLQRFLSFIVDEALSGRAGLIKEFPIGVEVFGKDSSFDPRMDPIVRVQARRLRVRLATYYRDEGHSDGIIIELPKGGYAPTFRRPETIAPKRPSGTALVSRNTVVVLPFADESAAGDQGYFCRGITWEIVNSLSGQNSIIVMSRDGIDERQSMEIAETAAMVISGSVRTMKNMFRITTRISDVARGCFIWSLSIDQDITDTFTAQEKVARLLLDAVRNELDAGKDRGTKRRTENVAADTLYLQGRYHLNQRTDQGLRMAVEFFTKAIAEDPQFSEAYAGLADAENLLAHYGVLAPADVWTKAASNAAQAVMLNSASAEALTSFAHIKSTQDWDWEGSELEFRRAMSINPRYAPAHHWYAVSCLTPLGRLDTAFDELSLAQRLDPVSSIISRDIALNHYHRRDFGSALEQCDHTIEQNPHFSPAYWTLGLVQEQRGDLDEAVAAFQRAIELSPPSLRVLGALGRALARVGRNDEALEILGELQELATRRYMSPFELALIHFALERKDEGFDLLAKAYQDRCYELVTIKVDPRFDSVANDPRFADLVRQIGLP